MVRRGRREKTNMGKDKWHTRQGDGGEKGLGWEEKAEEGENMDYRGEWEVWRGGEGGRRGDEEGNRTVVWRKVSGHMASDRHQILTPNKHSVTQALYIRTRVCQSDCCLKQLLSENWIFGFGWWQRGKDKKWWEKERWSNSNKQTFNLGGQERSPLSAITHWWFVCPYTLERVIHDWKVWMFATGSAWAASHISLIAEICVVIIKK